MSVSTQQIMDQLDELGRSIDAVKAQNADLRTALSLLVEIIDAAGGPFKLSAADRMEWAKKVLAEAAR